MTNRYIVKGCPALDDDFLQICTDDTGQRDCKDRTDCPIKQVVELCKQISDHAEWCNCPDYPGAPLANKILQTLDVQEVE